MQDYSVALTNTDGNPFPDTASINATGPSTTDGTEFVKALIDDIWGRNQALMNHAGLTPDGVTEADGTAQIIEALQKGFGGAPGFPMEWNLAADPGTTGHRCLLLQGQGILHANYPDLLAAVYVGDGNNAAAAAAGGAYYKATDAAGTIPNTAGTYLIMPDARGVVARGLDLAATIDPDGAGRYVGDLQVDAMQRITGSFDISRTTGGSDILVTELGVFADGGATNNQTVEVTGSAGTQSQQLDFDSSTSTSPNAAKTDDVETRMYNRSTRFVIWY